MNRLPLPLYQSYRARLEQSDIAPSSRSYYLRWLCLYWDACKQNGWDPDQNRHMPQFIRIVASRHPSPFLQQQAAQAIALFYENHPEQADLTTASQPQPYTTDSEKTDDPLKLPHATQLQLEAITRRVKGNLQHNVTESIALGEDLIRAKKLLPHGQFSAWLEREFELSQQSARRCMHVAKHFADKINTVLTLSQKALYELAAPGTSAELRAQVLRRLETGEAMSYLQIKAMKQQKLKAVTKRSGTTLQKRNQHLSHWLEQTRRELETFVNETGPGDLPDLEILRQQVAALDELIHNLLSQSEAVPPIV